MARPRGRHSRPSKTSKVFAASAATATTGAFAAVMVVSNTGPQPVLHVDKPAAMQVRETAFIVPSAPKVTVSAVKAHTDDVTTYTVKKGDSLSAIASSSCGNPSDWTGIYDANKSLTNPDLIEPGQNLVLDCAVEPVRQPAWWHANHQHHLAEVAAWAAEQQQQQQHQAPPAETDPIQAGNEAAPVQQPVQPVQQDSTVHSEAPVSTAGDGGFQSCVISRESGGNPHAVNAASGAGGLYQFLPSTWASLGFSGLPEDAPVSVQNEAFAKAYAESGTSPWAPSDGC